MVVYDLRGHIFQTLSLPITPVHPTEDLNVKDLSSSPGHMPAVLKPESDGEAGCAGWVASWCKKESRSPIPPTPNNERSNPRQP